MTQANLDDAITAEEQEETTLLAAVTDLITKFEAAVAAGQAPDLSSEVARLKALTAGDVSEEAAVASAENPAPAPAAEPAPAPVDAPAPTA